MSENIKTKANHDTTFCISKDCKYKCWRHEDNYEFGTGLYSFIDCCNEYENTRCKVNGRINKSNI